MAGHIQWSKVDIWLQAYRSIWLSTTRADGRPHCVPVWYWWDATTNKPNVYLMLHGDTAKVKNLAHQSWVVLNAGNGDDTVILEGCAYLVTDEQERAKVNELWQTKYVDPFSGAKAVAMEDNRIYRVEIQHIMVWEYGSINTRTDWHFERT
jgi:general stress protein 26